MTPYEEHIAARLREFAEELPKGARPEVSIYADEVRAYVHVGSWSGPDGYSLLGYGDTADAAIDDLIAKFRDRRAKADSDTTERLALAIIRLTYQHGACTAAQLRQDFGPDVERLVEAATTTANAMSDSGPFSVADDEVLANA